MDGLTEFLKTVKDGVGCYSVACYYGQQSLGLDDMDTPDDERQIRVIGSPAGYLGQLRCVWQGTLAEVLELDPFAAPEAVPNPPIEALMRGPYDMRPGAFCWGTPESVEDWPAKVEERRARWAAR